MTKGKKDGEKSRRIVAIVTGMSGAGKSTGLHALEDIGFEGVDNIPLTLIDQLIHNEGADEDVDHTPLAIGVDSRTRDFTSERLSRIIDELHARRDLDVRVVFFDCDDIILGNRFSETRRVHHLAPDRPVRDGISLERGLLTPIRERSDSLMDTSNLTTSVSRRRLQDRFRLSATKEMVIAVMSFGYSKGVPRDVDLVFDVRFLRNPHYDPKLRPLTGQNEDVVSYILADENLPKFRDKVLDLLAYLIPLYEAEDKHYLTVAFGCTGGKHRSVMSAEWAGKELSKFGKQVNIIHRDMPLAPAVD